MLQRRSVAEMPEEYEDDYEDEGFEEDEEAAPSPAKSPPRQAPAKSAAASSPRSPVRAVSKSPKEPPTPENLPEHVLEMRRIVEAENKRAKEKSRDKELVTPAARSPSKSSDVRSSRTGTTKERSSAEGKEVRRSVWMWSEREA